MLDGFFVGSSNHLDSIRVASMVVRGMVVVAVARAVVALL